MAARAPTLRLGELTGVWAPACRRRDHLEAQAAAEVLAAWREVAVGLDLTAVVTALRQQVGLGEATADLGADRRRHLRQVAAAAVLARLTSLTGRPAWAGLISAITGVLRRSRAAGQQAGDAVLDDDPDQLGDEEGDDGEGDGEGDPDEDTAAAYTTAAVALRGTAQAIARALLNAAEQGDDERAMQDQVDAVLTGGAAWTLAAATTAAAAFTDGLITAYRDRGTQQLDFITVGDGHVCQTCSNAEDRSPWPASSAPAPPLHGNCRCVLQPTT